MKWRSGPQVVHKLCIFVVQVDIKPNFDGEGQVKKLRIIIADIVTK